MANPYNDIFLFLKSNNFHFSESWVIECVNYYKNNNPNISRQVLIEEVRQQWLLLNLRDMKIPSFPPNLKDNHKVVLNGKYAVQVETLLDSGQSRFSQLQSLRNECLENIKATKSNNDEPPSRRCLTMSITDGVQDLSAMEYEVIPQLKLNDPDLTPGFKMLITGPVVCRKGMLLLRKENVVICGGEVDILTHTYRLEQLLANSIGVSVQAPSNIPQGAVGLGEDDFMDSLMNDNDFISDANFPDLQNSHNLPCHDPRPIISSSVILGNPNNLHNAVTKDTNQNSAEDNLAINDLNAFFENDDDIVLSAAASVINNNASVSVATNSCNKDLPKKQTSIVNFFKDESSLKMIDKTPFVYLSQIVQLNLSTDAIFRVKAVILTLKTKISIKNDKFTLICKICDGSLSVDVAFASEVLEGMLGFSPCEMTEMVKTKRSNPAVAERLKNAFISAQEALISFNCIFHVHFLNSRAMPCVVEIEKLNSSHLIALRARSKT